MSVEETMNYVLKIPWHDIERNLISRVQLKKIIKLRIILDKREINYPIYFYVGEKRDHVMIPYVFCSCKNFTIRVMSKKKKPSCKHLIMLRLALDKSMYREIYIEDLTLLKKIINEIIRIGLSPTLRKLLYISRNRRYERGRTDGA